jgi:hypothetical protein
MRLKMIRAILLYSNGLRRIAWVDSEPNGGGGYIVNDYTNDGETVFEFERSVKLTPIYKELDVTMEDFYGYEAKEG